MNCGLFLRCHAYEKMSGGLFRVQKNRNHVYSVCNMVRIFLLVKWWYIFAETQRLRLFINEANEYL